MAGDWIKMRMDLHEDPAVFRIMSITKLDRLAVIGRLYAFWSWADKFAVDGRVDVATSTVVDEIVMHIGFADAMVSVKWLHINEDSISIPNHDRHNGESAKERALKNQRQARWRAGKDATSSTDVDAPPSTGTSTTASTREEKRREEIETKEETRKRAPSVERPSDVGEQIWQDWVDLRKGKRAKVSLTVIDEARAESMKAGVSFERFLAIWCARGSQGLQADWLKPHERASAADPDWRAEQRQRTQLAAPGVAANKPADQFFIEVEARNVTTHALD